MVMRTPAPAWSRCDVVIARVPSSEIFLVPALQALVHLRDAWINGDGTQRRSVELSMVALLLAPSSDLQRALPYLREGLDDDVATKLLAAINAMSKRLDRMLDAEIGASK